jgi:hypothetical protein
MAKMPEWLERAIKKIDESKVPRLAPPQYRYPLSWSILLPYTQENVDFVEGVGSCVYEL